MFMEAICQGTVFVLRKLSFQSIRDKRDRGSLGPAYRSQLFESRSAKLYPPFSSFWEDGHAFITVESGKCDIGKSGLFSSSPNPRANTS
jgi:hypothetical protein